MHRPSPKFGSWTLILAFSLSLLVAPASFAADDRAPEAGVVRAPDGGSLWSAWLEIWAPIASWFAGDLLGPSGGGLLPEETTGTGSGDPGGLGPGSGGGIADPSG